MIKSNNIMKKNVAPRNEWRTPNLIWLKINPQLHIISISFLIARSQWKYHPCSIMTMHPSSTMTLTMSSVMVSHSMILPLAVSSSSMMPSSSMMFLSSSSVVMSSSSSMMAFFICSTVLTVRFAIFSSSYSFRDCSFWFNLLFNFLFFSMLFQSIYKAIFWYLARFYHASQSTCQTLFITIENCSMLIFVFQKLANLGKSSTPTFF